MASLKNKVIETLARLSETELARVVEFLDLLEAERRSAGSEQAYPEPAVPASEVAEALPAWREEAEVFEAALSLSAAARAELVEQLLQSMEGPDQAEFDARWAEEAEDRLLAFERGEIRAIPGEEVLASLRLNKA